MQKKLWKDRCRFACFVGLRGTESAGFVGFWFKRAGREIMFLAGEKLCFVGVEVHSLRGKYP